MNLMILGLTLNLLGSVFLGLHIIGEENLKKFESIIKNLPTKLSKKISHSFFEEIIQKIIYKSKKVQLNIKYLIEFGEEKGEKANLFEVGDNRTKSILISYLGFMFFLAFIFFIVLLPVFLPIYILITPFRIIQDKLKLKSFFGIIGILMLFLGYLFQIIAL